MENKAAKSTVMNVTNELTVACVKKSTSHSQNIISPIIIRHFPKLQLEKTIAVKGKQNLAFQQILLQKMKLKLQNKKYCIKEKK